jgi:RsiW-degrading membrane proteinase PrsW (M82 family)
LIGWATLALALAWLGFAFTKRDRGPKRLPVLSGMAVLFAIGGLVGGLLDLALIAILLCVGRRWIFW